MKKVYIELSDICHLACSFCPAPKGARGVMSLAVFARALDSVLSVSNRIALHILGDPCALPNLSQYLALAHKKHAQIELVTSGAFCHKHSPQTLLAPPIYQLSISLEAGVDNAIASYGAKLAPVLAYHLQNPSCFVNLRIQDLSLYQHPQILCDLLRQILPESTLSHKACHPALRHALMHGNINTLFDENGRIRLWSRAFLLVKPHFTWAGFAPANARIQATPISTPISATSPFMPAAAPASTPAGAHGRSKPSGRFCHGLIEQIGILSDGTIVPCCMDTQGAIALGNIRTHSLEEALQSPRAQSIITGFHRGIAIEPLCQSCGFRG